MGHGVMHCKKGEARCEEWLLNFSSGLASVRWELSVLSAGSQVGTLSPFAALRVLGLSLPPLRLLMFQ
eukprot:2729877-Amphidinium_carterae.1